MMGDKAKPALAAMKRALASSRKAKGPVAEFMPFVLQPAVKALESQ